MIRAIVKAHTSRSLTRLRAASNASRGISGGLHSEIDSFKATRQERLSIEKSSQAMMESCLSMVKGEGDGVSALMLALPSNSQQANAQSDVSKWIKHYAEGSPKIALIKVGGAVLSDEPVLAQLCSAVAFLKNTGLFPVLIHGGGPQLNDHLESLGVVSDYITGIRITTPLILQHAQRIFVQQNIKLVDALERHGVTARGVSPAVFAARPLGPEYGLVGEVTDINLDLIASSLRAGHVPVLYSLAITASGQVMNINADVAAKELAVAIKADKVVYLNATGGLMDDKKQLIPCISLPEDYHSLLAKPWVKHGLLLKLKEIKELMDEMPRSSTVSVTSPAKLLSELYTTAGDGTLFKWSSPTATKPGLAGTRAFSTMARPEKKFRVGLIGARGYVGAELIKLLSIHPSLELVAASSRSLAGRPVAEVAGIDRLALSQPDLAFREIGPEDAAARLDVDVWYLALPNGLAAPFVSALASSGKLLVDLSGDHRFQEDWLYGLPELNRGKLTGARKISNPGCYATGAQVALMPLVGGGIGEDLIAGTPSVFGISGYSGAGTTPSDKNDVSKLRDNLMPYALTGHLHEREISRHLGRPVYFIPTVASYFRGIQLTASVSLRRHVTREEIASAYHKRYDREALIKVVSAPPQVKNIAGKHHVEVSFEVSKDGMHAVVCATIDNLLKGAATQAIQNTNIALGLEEYAGLTSLVPH